MQIGESVTEARSQKKQTEPLQHYPRRAPDKSGDKSQERNHAELPMQLGLASKENG